MITSKYTIHFLLTPCLIEFWSATSVFTEHRVTKKGTNRVVKRRTAEGVRVESVQGEFSLLTLILKTERNEETCSETRNFKKYRNIEIKKERFDKVT